MSKGLSVYAPTNLVEAKEMAKMISQSSFVPNIYRNKPVDVLLAMQMGESVGLNPLQSLQSIAVVNNLPTLYGAGAMAIITGHPEFAGIEEKIEDKTATCTIYRLKGSNKINLTGSFSWEDAERAGLTTRQVYKKSPKDMLMWRARHRAFKLFADALMGLSIYEVAKENEVIINEQKEKKNEDLKLVLSPNEKLEKYIEEGTANYEVLSKIEHAVERIKSTLETNEMEGILMMIDKVEGIDGIEIII